MKAKKKQQGREAHKLIFLTIK